MHVLWRHVLTNNTHYINNDEIEKKMVMSVNFLRVGRNGGTKTSRYPTLIIKQHLK